ncbi:MAG TPA: DUF3027 domain-containing protein [Hyphomonadaceae bacterium]|jgi:hypothetical protein|nr:DUF3027 domain-containing protein [Hyphomonadaceae bacterium]
MAENDNLHDRWTSKLNRDVGSPDYREEWRVQQCLHCTFYVPLSGALGQDFGACSNARSKFDKTVMFEHDGCEHHRHEDQ